MKTPGQTNSSSIASMEGKQRESGGAPGPRRRDVIEIPILSKIDAEKD